MLDASTDAALSYLIGRAQTDPALLDELVLRFARLCGNQANATELSRRFVAVVSSERLKVRKQ